VLHLDACPWSAPRQARRRDGIPASAPRLSCVATKRGRAVGVPLATVNYGHQRVPVTRAGPRSRPLTAHRAQPSKLAMRVRFTSPDPQILAGRWSVSSRLWTFGARLRSLRAPPHAPHGATQGAYLDFDPMAEGQDVEAVFSGGCDRRRRQWEEVGQAAPPCALTWSGGSQIRISARSPVEASNHPSGAAANTATVWVWPVRVWRAQPVAGSQIRSSLPSPAQTSQDPSGATEAPRHC